MNFAVGDFIGVLVDFMIVAAVVFLIARYAKRLALK
jgi:large-conductance mechanosensitive channel